MHTPETAPEPAPEPHTEPAPETHQEPSYEDIPYYRKQWFFWIGFLLCAPAALILLLSGNIYYKKNNKAVPFGVANKVAAVLLALVWIRGAYTYLTAP
jgi:hypothetical protein